MTFTTLRNWLRQSRRTRHIRLTCERLEDRIQPTTLTRHADIAVSAAVSYWAGAEPITLDVRAHELVVGLSHGAASLAPLIADHGPLAGMTVSQWITSDLAILRSVAATPIDPLAELNSRFQAASNSAGVTFAAPVYQNPITGSWLIATNELIVAVKEGVDPQAALADPRFASWEPLSGTHDQFIVRAAAGYGPAVFELNAQLQHDPRFDWATPNFYQDFRKFLIPNDTLFSSQWHLHNTGQYAGATVDADVDAPEAWDVTTGSQEVIIAIIDDGMEITHPDLGPNIAINQAEIPAAVLAALTDVDGDGIISFYDLNNPINIGAGKAQDLNGNGRIDPDDILRPIATGGWADGVDGGGNGYIDDLCGWDFTTNGTTGDLNPGADSTNDEHATSVAGVAAGVGNNALGITGIAFRSRLLPVRMFGSTGNATSDANIASAIYYSAGRNRNGIGTFRSGDIQNHSWGGGSASTAIQSAFQWASTNGRNGLGTATFISSGNDYEPSISFPASLAGTISGVMAVGASTDRETRSTYSNYGPQLDFMAPSDGPGFGGVYGIVTTDRLGSNGYNTASGASGDYTNTVTSAFGGTSSASPLAAGIGALVLSRNLNLTAAQIRGLLRNTTDLIGPVNPDYDLTTGFNAELGYGRLNANTAVRGVGVTEIQVLDGRTNVPDNIGSVNFGTAYIGITSVTRSFRVRNQGTLPLTLGTPTLTGPFELATGFGSTTLNVGQSTTFTIHFRPMAVGAASGTISFATNDPDESIFNFALTGTGQAPSLGGTAFEDWNGNGTRESGDPALAGRTVYIDQNGNGTFDAALPAVPYSSGTINIAIPDGNTTGITNTRVISGVSGQVAKVTVTVNISHTFTGDLTIDLIGPNNTYVNLVNRRGGSGNNFTNTIFDDAAATAITSGSPPFSGTFRPEQLLSTFNGIPANGTWGLRVRDLAPQDTGTLVNWTLTLTMGEINQTTLADGVYGFGGLAAGNYDVRTVTPSGWNATGPAGGVHTVTLTAGGAITGLDFGSARQNAIYGNVFDDLNGNSIRDGGEPGVGNWFIYDDRNNSGTHNGTEVSVLSGANGNYVLTGLTTGPTRIRMIPQSGYVNTLAASGIPVTISAGATSFNFDFGAVFGSPPPTVDIIDVSPDPRYSSVNTITIVFSEAVTGFDLADLSLTRSGGPNLLSGSQTLTTTDSITWTLGNLGGLTAPIGTYTLTLTAAGSGIANLASTPLASNASDTWQVVAVPSLSINDVSGSEGASGTVPLTFTVSLSSAALEPVSVSYSTADGTATVGDSDYQATSGTLTFLPGESSKTIVVQIVGDARNEANETFTVNLTSPTNATIADGQGIGTILNDDPVPTLSIAPVTNTEGNSGTTAFVFTVTLSAVSGQAVTVNYATANGTALLADNDYQSASGTLTFAPGVVSQAITVLVVGDTTFEVDESFTVTLGGPVNATIATGTATGTITNDDTPPTLSIDAVAVSEGNSGTTPFVFTVTLSAPSGLPVTVNYATSDGTATLVDGDYQSASGTLTFTPGVTTRTLTVLGNGDTRFEADETFVVTLSGATNATLASATATGTIVNDDAVPTLSINSLSRNEGNSASTAFGFSISLSTASGQPVTVNYTTMDGSATQADGDYSAVSGTLTFAPGVTVQTITVPVNGDTRNEADEIFTVVLSNPTNAAIGTGIGTGTIVNDDPVPALVINSITRAEGDSGFTMFDFTVSLSAVSGQTVTVNFATADGTATVMDGDYAAAVGTLTFAPGTLSQTVTIAVRGDVKNEASETFIVQLSGATNASIATATGTGTITNDDPVPTLAINSVAVEEGNSGTTPLMLTVSLSAASGQTVTVAYATADGTALIADGDYLAASGILTFAPGTTTQAITILVTSDTRNEIDETFTVVLSGAVNANIATVTGTGTILNDDPMPTININSVSRNEDDFGPVGMTFTVSLSAVSGQTVTAAYATVDGTATGADGDYQPANGLLTFAPGVTTQTITIPVLGDLKNEADEIFSLVLSTPQNATLGLAIGTGTILNDDPVPSLSLSSATGNEGNSGTTAFTFTATLSAVSGQTVTVNFATADGTATVADGDYLATNGLLTFAPGVTSQTITIPVVGDPRNEINETFTLNLSGATHAVIASGVGTGTILNDDPVPTLSIDSVTQNEGTGSPSIFLFTVSLSEQSGRTITVNYTTIAGTATIADFSAVNGTVTFTPGTTTQSIAVLVNGDTTYEPDEEFRVQLTSPTNAVIAVGTGTGTIVNDDPLPAARVSLTGTPFIEAGGIATVTVTLSNPSAVPVTVGLVFDGTASPTDYTVSSANAVITPGQMSTSITLTGINDTLDENDETIRVRIGSVINGVAGVSDTVVATIIDNDLPVAVPDTFALFEDVPYTAAAGSLQANDNTAPGSTVELVGLPPPNGTFILDPNGGFTFTPVADSNGTVTFQYRVRNAAGEVSNPTTASLVIAPVNDPPRFVAGPARFDPRRAGPQVIPGWAAGIVAGPADERDQQLTFLVTTDRPDLFLVQPSVDPMSGTLTYTPSSGYGTAILTLQVRDNGGSDFAGSDLSEPHTVAITIYRYQDDDLPTNQYEMGQLAVGSGDAGAAVAYLGDGTQTYGVSPFAGVGTRTATADVTGDGVADVIVGTGPGSRARVRIFDGVTRTEIRTLLPFEDSFTGGLFVAAADVDGDGMADIAVSPDVGGGGRVTVFSGRTGTQLANFFGIDDDSFRGGARVAFGDVNADGRPDLIVAAGFGGGPRIAIFSGSSLTTSPNRLLNDFYGFPGRDATTLRNGTYVAAGDIDGDGYAELVIGGGPGGGPRVFVLSGRKLAQGDVAGAQVAPVANFFVANDDANRSGVRVAVKDFDGDDFADLVTGSGGGLRSQVRIYSGNRIVGGAGEPAGVRVIDPFEQILNDGVYVG